MLENSEDGGAPTGESSPIPGTENGAGVHTGVQTVEPHEQALAGSPAPIADAVQTPGRPSEEEQAKQDRQFAKLHYERNCLAVAFIRIAQRVGWPLGALRPRKGDAYLPQVLVDLPQGQVSWSFPQEFFDRNLSDLPMYAGDWDGSNDAQKFERLLEWPQA